MLANTAAGGSADTIVVVAHASLLIRAGIVSTLKRLPRCVVRVWEHGPYCAPRRSRAPHVLVGDEERVSQAIVQDAATGAAVSNTRFVVLTKDSEPSNMPGLHQGVHRQLSIACAEDELFDAVRGLADAGQPVPHASAPCRTARGGMAPGALRRVYEHIERHLIERITMSELASIAGLSDCHFSRAFKQSVGMPPHRYVMQCRIERAAVLIETTNRPLAEIALEVGFSDQSHFSRLFTEARGETPRDFRQRHR